MTRLCKDCRWGVDKVHSQPRRRYDWDCTHPALSIAPGPDYVLGEVQEPYPMPCIDARKIVPGRCGPDGKFWEPRDQSSGIGFV